MCKREDERHCERECEGECRRACVIERKDEVKVEKISRNRKKKVKIGIPHMSSRITYLWDCPVHFG